MGWPERKLKLCSPYDGLYILNIYIVPIITIKVRCSIHFSAEQVKSLLISGYVKRWIIKRLNLHLFLGIFITSPLSLHPFFHDVYCEGSGAHVSRIKAMHQSIRIQCTISPCHRLTRLMVKNTEKLLCGISYGSSSFANVCI